MHIWFMEDSILSRKRAIQNGFAVAVLISGVSAPVAFFFFFLHEGKASSALISKHVLHISENNCVHNENNDEKLRSR